MSSILIIKDFKVRLTLSLASSLTKTLKSGTVLPLNDNFVTIVSCDFEIQVNPFTTFPIDVFKVISPEVNHA